ncbi:MAG: YfcE family phosphodiesterase [Halobacteriaceae archaeon]
MIVALADTHRETGHGLAGHTAAAVERADWVIHAGDFTTQPVLEAFQAVTGRLVAVHGNRDVAGVCERLPATDTVEVGDSTLVVTHRSASGDAGLGYLGRAHDAALVIAGHTHRPRIGEVGGLTLLNPGSHTTPRGGPPTHAELRECDDGLRVRIVTRDGRCQEYVLVA